METPYRFNAESLSLDERFGYSRQVWPRLRERLALPARSRVLEVGCGNGAFTRFLVSSVGSGSEVVGVDRDAVLLDEARAKTPAPDDVKVSFEVGDALSLERSPASFDSAFSAFLLCVIPEPLAALAEMRRVVRPGGLVASLSCFCKSGIFPTFAGLHEFDGAERLEALRRRFEETRRVHVRNPMLGLPNGRDLDVWGDYARAGLEDLRIDGFLTVFAPSDARWSDAEAREFVEGRRRIELAMVDNLGAGDREKLARGGFSAADLAELRALLARKFGWLLADDARFRRGMEIVAEPAVLITGRVPR